MEPNILFEEVQYSAKKPVRDFFKITTGLFILALVFNLVWQKGTINDLTAVVLAGLLICALANIFLAIKMVTQIRSDGIYVRFPPFQPSVDKYSWESIDEVYLRDFNALREYSAWGVRLGTWGVKFGAAGKGFLFWGNKGIQLVLHDGSRILISTQRPEELARVLSGLKK